MLYSNPETMQEDNKSVIYSITIDIDKTTDELSQTDTNIKVHQKMLEKIENVIDKVKKIESGVLEDKDLKELDENIKKEVKDVTDLQDKIADIDNEENKSIKEDYNTERDSKVKHKETLYSGGGDAIKEKANLETQLKNLQNSKNQSGNVEAFNKLNADVQKHINKYRELIKNMKIVEKILQILKKFNNIMSKLQSVNDADKTFKKLNDLFKKGSNLNLNWIQIETAFKNIKNKMKENSNEFNGIQIDEKEDDNAPNKNQLKREKKKIGKRKRPC